MTPEMIKIAEEITQLSAKYKRLYKEEYRDEPVVYIEVNDESNELHGNAVFIADSYNTSNIHSYLSTNLAHRIAGWYYG